MEIQDICRELKYETTARGKELLEELLSAVLANLETIRIKLTGENK